MPISLQHFLMMLISKLAPLSLRSLAGNLKIKIYPCHRNVAMFFSVRLGVMYTVACFIKWSQKTKMFTMFGADPTA